MTDPRDGKAARASQDLAVRDATMTQIAEITARDMAPARIPQGVIDRRFDGNAGVARREVARLCADPAPVIRWCEDCCSDISDLPGPFDWSALFQRYPGILRATVIRYIDAVRRRELGGEIYQPKTKSVSNVEQHRKENLSSEEMAAMAYEDDDEGTVDIG